LAGWLAGALLASASVVATVPAPAGASTAAVFPSVGVVTDLTWGISRAEMQRTIDLLVASKVRSVRLNVSWSGVEPNAKGVLNTGWLAELDAAVSMARTAGLDVLMPIADGVPYWASADPAKAGGSWNKMWRPTLMSDYGDFVRFVVSHYSPMGVNTYEIWNEPNHPTFWPSGINAADYTEMLRAGSAAVRKTNPSAKVVMGGLTKSDHTYMQALYAAGAGPLFDIAAIHPYTGGVSPTWCWTDATGLKAKDAFCGIEAVRDVMVANGDSAKPLWLTEFGVTEAQQASYLTEAYTWLSTRTYVTNTFWYAFRNTYWLNDNPKEHEANTGVLRTDYTTKPAYAAMAAVGAAQAAGGLITSLLPPVLAQPPAAASRFTSLSPSRILDTRTVRHPPRSAPGASSISRSPAAAACQPTQPPSC
jgi:hypothetical protein